MALPGVGTGLDLQLLPPVACVVGVDLTPEMLERARRAGGVNVPSLLLGDAQRMPIADAACDAVVLHLILSVAPDGRAVLAEACRVLKPGGRMAIFDKFASERGASPIRRALNTVTRVAGTEITRRFDVMADGMPLERTGERAAIRGAYRIIWLRRM